MKARWIVVVVLVALAAVVADIVLWAYAANASEETQPAFVGAASAWGVAAFGTILGVITAKATAAFDAQAVRRTELNRSVVQLVRAAADKRVALIDARLHTDPQNSAGASSLAAATARAKLADGEIASALATIRLFADDKLVAAAKAFEAVTVDPDYDMTAESTALVDAADQLR